MKTCLNTHPLISALFVSTVVREKPQKEIFWRLLCRLLACSPLMGPFTPAANYAKSLSRISSEKSEKWKVQAEVESWAHSAETPVYKACLMNAESWVIEKRFLVFGAFQLIQHKYRHICLYSHRQKTKNYSSLMQDYMAVVEDVTFGCCL